MLNRKVKQLVLRVLAIYAVYAIPVVTASAVLGLDVLKSAAMAGLVGVGTVIVSLAKAYANDGRLTNAEIDGAFGSVGSDAEDSAE